MQDPTYYADERDYQQRADEISRLDYEILTARTREQECRLEWTISLEELNNLCAQRAAMDRPFTEEIPFT